MLSQLKAQGIMGELQNRTYSRYSRSACNTFPTIENTDHWGISTQSIGAGLFDVAAPVAFHMLLLSALVLARVHRRYVREKLGQPRHTKRPGTADDSFITDKSNMPLTTRRAQMKLLGEIAAALKVEAAALVAHVRARDAACGRAGGDEGV